MINEQAGYLWGWPSLGVVVAAHLYVGLWLLD